MEAVMLIIGVLIGIFLCYAYLRCRLVVEFGGWKMEFEGKLKQDVLEKSRAALRGRIGEQIVPLLPFFTMRQLTRGSWVRP
jgi:hypothetical protein